MMMCVFFDVGTHYGEHLCGTKFFNGISHVVLIPSMHGEFPVLDCLFMTPVLTRREVCELNGESTSYLQRPPDHRKVERKKELGE